MTPLCRLGAPLRPALATVSVTTALTLALLASAASPAGAATARAVPAPVAAPAATSAADLAREAMDHYVAGDLLAARRLLAVSVARMATPHALAWLLLTEAKLGRCADVAERAAWLDPKALPPVLAAAVATATAADGPCPLPPEAAYRCDGELQVDTDPAGASVRTSQRGDGGLRRHHGQAPVRVRGLCPGTVAVTATLWMHEEAATVLTVAPGARASAALRLSPEPAARFYDRQRRTAALALVTAAHGGRDSGARPNLGERSSLGATIAGMLFSELRLTAGALWLRSEAGGAGGAVDHALLLRARGEWTLPMLRGAPLTGSDARWIAGGVGAGADVWLGRPLGALAYADASLHLWWLTLRAFAGIGSGLVFDRGPRWGHGVEVALSWYL